ncbi:MAG: Rrf2 family transcriptional regulator [Lachnospiraceae bacterium]|nr:Rrf2 family transcriptional regulator [Lachnospiraceae bacterium]
MKFTTKYTLALQILCICHLYADQKITSNFIAEKTGADSSLIRYTMLDLKKKNYISSRPGPGGTTLSEDISKITLFDVYELVSDPNDSILKFNELPPSATSLDIGINESIQKSFEDIKQEMFAKMKQTTILDICKEIN